MTLGVRAVQVGLLYFAAAAACVLLTRLGGAVAPVWIASAVLLRFLLAEPIGRWPALVAVACAANIAANTLGGDPLIVALSYMTANMAETLLAAWLLRRNGDTVELADRAEVVRFLLICGVAAPGLSTLIMLSLARLFPAHLGAMDGWIWFAAVLMGFLIYLPVLKVFDGGRWRVFFARGRRGLACLMFACLIGFNIAAAAIPNYPALLLAELPILTFIAFGFGLAGVEAGLALTATVWLGASILGHSPVMWRDEPRDQFVALQGFLAVCAASMLALAAAIEQKNRLLASTAEALKEAQQAWSGLLAAQMHLQLLADRVTELVLQIDPAGTVLFATRSWKDLLGEDVDIEGANLFGMIHPDDLGGLCTRASALGAPGDSDRREQWAFQVKSAAGEWIGLTGEASSAKLPDHGSTIILALRRLSG